MDIKGRIKTLPASNAKLNFDFYRVFGTNRRAMDDLVARCTSIDSIQDVEALRQFRHMIEKDDVPYFTTDANWSNSHIYGIWDSLFGNTAIPLWFTPSVEHGLIFYSEIFTDTRYTARPAIATFGDYRRKVIRGHTDRPIFTVGPYIHYAKPYYNAKIFASLKAQMGRTLLVFPTHSTNDSSITQDQERFIKEVDHAASDFDTVLVSAFWWNVDDPLIYALENRGYHIASAGFRDDVQFLSRLRTMIELADVAVGDSMGTHVGYVLSMGKPYYHMNMGTRIYSIEQREWGMDPKEKLKEDILASLSATDYDVRKVMALSEPYWGYSYERTREDLRIMTELSCEIGRRSGGWVSRFGSTARKMLAQMDEDSLEAKLLAEALV